MAVTLLDKVIELGHTSDKAKRIIMSGIVKVNDTIVFIPSEPIKSGDSVVIKKTKEWVSRGAYKLLAAIDEFGFDFQDKIVLDIGSSTGGFTEVSLKNGAKHVFALDVGTNQLAYKIRADEKVTPLEKTNLKTITPDMFDQQIDIVVTDVSFISLRHVFNVVSNLGNKSLKIMALIKPQFEANSNQVEPGGIVPKDLHEGIIKKVKQYAEDNGFELIKINESPIKGKKTGNIEYITMFERNKDE